MQEHMTEYTHHMTEYTPAKTGEYRSNIPQFSLSHIHNLYFAFHRIKSLFLILKYITLFPKNILSIVVKTVQKSQHELKDVRILEAN